jgi:hypothetical protein
VRGSHWRWTILDQPHLPCDSFLCSKSEIEEQLHAMQLVALEGERISLVSHGSAAKQSNLHPVRLCSQMSHWPSDEANKAASSQKSNSKAGKIARE